MDLFEEIYRRAKNLRVIVPWRLSLRLQFNIKGARWFASTRELLPQIGPNGRLRRDSRKREERQLQERGKGGEAETSGTIRGVFWRIRRRPCIIPNFFSVFIDS